MIKSTKEKKENQEKIKKKLISLIENLPINDLLEFTKKHWDKSCKRRVTENVVKVLLTISILPTKQYGRKKWKRFIQERIAGILGVNWLLIHRILQALEKQGIIEHKKLSTLAKEAGISYNKSDQAKLVHLNTQTEIGALFYYIAVTDGGKKQLKYISKQNCKGWLKENLFSKKKESIKNINQPKTGEFLRFKEKIDDTATARAYRVLAEQGVEVKPSKAQSRYIHYALNKLACKRKIGLSITTDEVISRFKQFVKQQIAWLKEHGVRVCIHFLLKSKAIGAYLYRLFNSCTSTVREWTEKLQTPRKQLIDAEQYVFLHGEDTTELEARRDQIKILINGKFPLEKMKKFQKVFKNFEVTISSNTSKPKNFLLRTQKRPVSAGVGEITQKLFEKFLHFNSDAD